jgi:hypothetical protein
MHTNRWPLLIIIISLFFAIYWLREKEKVIQKKILTTHSVSSNKKLKTLQHMLYTNSSTKKTKPISQKNLHPQNMNLMIKVLRQSTYQPNLKKTLDLLHSIKTNPTYFQDTNSSTGTMHVIRTESPLPGTRYFHAQFFSDQTKDPFLQHISFEIPPGPSSFQLAARILKQNFTGLSLQPEIQKEGFILWKWKDGFNVWVLRLGKDHLLGDPFNAYEAKDEGTIRIAVEKDVPHSHDVF